MNLLDLTKKNISEVWKEALRLNTISYEDNFFELGGHSLIAAKISSKLNHQYKIKLSVTDIFKFPTINELVALICNDLNKKEEVFPLQKCDRSKHYPLSLGQNRLWFLYQLRPDIPLYSFPMTVKIVGDIQIATFRMSLQQLIKRHESLRTTIELIDGQAYQKILSEDTEFPFKEEVIGPCEQDEMVARLNLEIATPFHLESELLCRCLLLHLSPQEKVACFLFHHMIFDDWSMDIFSREFTLFYKSLKDKQTIQITPLPIQYLEFSVSQNNFLGTSQFNNQLSYWEKKLSDIIPTPLPIDYLRPKLLSYQGQSLQKKISKQTLISLNNFAIEQNVSLFILLLTCFKCTLSLISDAEDIVIGSPVSNRPISDQKDIIGYFVNTLVFRTIFSKTENFISILKKVTTTVLEGYQAQDVPFEKIVSELKPLRELNKNPLFQVMFSIAYETEMEPIKIDTAEVIRVDIPPLLSKFDISLHAQIKIDSIEFRFEYLTELFKLESISNMADIYLSLLETLIKEPNFVLSQIASPFIKSKKNEENEVTPILENPSDVSSQRHLSHIEGQLLAIWRQLLQKEEIKFENNFFDLGGNSLLVIQMCNAIKNSLNLSIAVIDIFQYPTIRSLARYCAGKKIPNDQKQMAYTRKIRFLQALQYMRQNK